MVLALWILLSFKGIALAELPKETLLAANHLATSLGEKESTDFYGPTNPSFEYNDFSSAPTSRDDRLSEVPYYKHLNVDLMGLDHFLHYDLPVSGQCSNVSLGQHANYIRYLYRLVVLSYLYEANMSMSTTLKKLNINNHPCQLNWSKVLKQCEAKSSDMKTFLRRAGQIVSQSELILPQDHSYKKFSESWWQLFSDKNNKTDTTSIRLRQICKDKKMNCENDLVGMQKNLGEVCEKDRQSFLLICSELDQGHGYSEIPLVKDLISSSNAMAIINGSGEGVGCLTRYQEQNKYRETRNTELEMMFVPLFNSIKSNLPSRFQLGRLFLPGALKEFDDKGLKEFLFAEATPTATPTKAPTPVATPLIVKTATPTPTPKPTKAPTPVPKIVVIATPVPVKKSAFLLAAEKLDKEHLDQVKVDMDQLKTDLVFSASVVSKLHENLKKFQTRQALQDMKEFDFLGTKAVPVKLIFLKYLIENNEHQGLFNMRAILGDSFYVQNDLDKFKKGQANPNRLILILNNADTANRWQIFVKRETTKP